MIRYKINFSIFFFLICLSLAACGGGSNSNPGSNGSSGTDGGTGSISAICGDGNVEADEECDDGNQSNDDACFTNCTKAPDNSNLKALNDFCNADAECESGKCMAGYCSECKIDADCPQGGCTLTNTFKDLGAFCNMGEAGAGCQTDEVCLDPNNSICGLINETTKLGTISTCGECDTNSDCPVQAPNCTPVYDFHSYSGRKTCVADASLAVGKSCSPDPDVNNNNKPLGDKACASGFCVPVEFGGGVWGECFECLSDSDCDNMQSCNVDGSALTNMGSWGIVANQCE